MKRAPRIALLVDNPFRDLPGMVLVARALAERGAEAILVPMNLRYGELWPLMPDFVLLNHLRRIYESLALDLLTAGLRVGVLDTEGGVYSPAASREADDDAGDADRDLDEYAVSMVTDDEIRFAVDPMCAWSARFAARAADKGWFRREHLAVTGAPRIDFYAAPWRQAALDLVPEAAQYERNLILINSTFPLANAAFLSPEKELALLCNEIGYPPAYAAQAMEAQRAGMAGLTALANRLAALLPEATIVYRPHPFEDEGAYARLLERRPNLHCVKKGTVNGWLLRAKALIQLGSSTAIDAALAGIPAFTPDWLPCFPPVPSIRAVSVGCPDETTLCRQIGDVLEGRFSMPMAVRNSVAQVVERTFHRVDGRCHERVADAVLAAVARSGRRTSRRRCAALAVKLDQDTTCDRLAGRAYRMLRWRYRRGGMDRAQARVAAWDGSPKRFGVSDVRQALAALERAAAPRRPLEVVGAEADGAYRLPHVPGRAVVVRPCRAGEVAP